MICLKNEIEEQRYGRNKSAIVNHSYIESGEYRKKFDQITDNADLSRLLYEIAKKILYHRSGSLFEDMYWIDLDTISVIASETESREHSKINYSKKTYKAIKEHENILTIHSHPHSTPPSIADINSNAKFGYYVGIIVCHNGVVYMYSSEITISEVLFNLIASDFRKDGYNDDESHSMTLKKLDEEGFIIFKEVTINGT